MKLALVHAVVVALIGVGTVAAGETAREQFQANCLTCHQPPDVRFATDRAWLEQITRTA